MRLFLVPDCFSKGLRAKDYLSSDSVVNCFLRTSTVVFRYSVLKVFINMESMLCFQINMTVFSVFGCDNSDVLPPIDDSPFLQPTSID